MRCRICYNIKSKKLMWTECIMRGWKGWLTNACLRGDPWQTEEQDDSPNIQHATNLYQNTNGCSCLILECCVMFKINFAHSELNPQLGLNSYHDPDYPAKSNWSFDVWILRIFISHIWSWQAARVRSGCSVHSNLHYLQWNSGFSSNRWKLVI